jgi:peptidoglycan/LPS O-acetylase OafA/YrhL
MAGSEQRRFLPRIESMRGIAAMTVALMHVTSSWVDAPSGGAVDAIGLKAIKALSNGYGAVVAFFVISGFVLARSLDRDFDALRFARARIFRLFPAAITTIAIFATAFYAFGFSPNKDASFTPPNIVANMLMLHVDIDRVMWSMKAELAATPLIFACVWLFRRYGDYPVAAIAWVLFGLSFMGQYWHAIGNDTNLSPLYAFPVGILVHFRGAALAERLKPRTVTLVALISIGVFCACSFFKPEGTFAILVECVSAATLVMLIAYRADAAIFAPLDLPIVRFYGRISYSFYLLHPLSFWAAARVTGNLLGQLGWLPVAAILMISFVFSVVAITPLAYVSWRYVEQPALRWRSARPPRGSAAVSGDVRVAP